MTAIIYKLIISFFIICFISSCGDSGDQPVEQEKDQGQPEPKEKTFADLCAQTGVIFCDDFESDIHIDWIRDGGDVVVVTGSVKAGEGSRVLELRTYDTKQTSKLLYVFPNQDLIHVRYDVKYAEDYDNSGGSHGPILGGSVSPPWGMLGKAGIKPDGTDHFVQIHEPLSTVGNDGEFGFYSYFVNMQADGNGDYWGNVFKANKQDGYLIERERWICVEFNLSLNTPGDTTDGKSQFWIDSVLHGEFTGIQWRTSPDLAINTFVLDSYNHFRYGARTADQPNRVQYDNVIISTSRIGCL